MRNQKQSGSAHVIIIVILIIALIGALGFIFWQNFLNNHKNNSVDSQISSSTKEQVTNTQNTTQTTTPKIVYKTFTSPLSGYTVEYPQDWIVSDNTGGIFTNNYGGKSYTFHVQDVARTGSYDGHDANTYICVDIVDYSGTWYAWNFNSNNHLTKLDQFQPHDNTTLGLYIDSQSADPTITGTMVYVTDSTGSDRNVKFGDGYTLNADVSYNCIQGDGAAITNSTEKFLSKSQTTTAIAILKSLRF